MEQSLKLAIEVYAKLINMSEKDVMLEIKSGNEVIKNSVMMLLFSAA